MLDNDADTLFTRRGFDGATIRDAFEDWSPKTSLLSPHNRRDRGTIEELLPAKKTLSATIVGSDLGMEEGEERDRESMDCIFSRERREGGQVFVRKERKEEVFLDERERTERA